MFDFVSVLALVLVLMLVLVLGLVLALVLFVKKSRDRVRKNYNSLTPSVLPRLCTAFSRPKFKTKPRKTPFFLGKVNRINCEQNKSKMAVPNLVPLYLLLRNRTSIN